MISGCHDVQTSADVSNVDSFNLPDPSGRAGGACTSAILQGTYYVCTVYFILYILCFQKDRDIDADSLSY